MSAHFLRLERLKARREQSKGLVVSHNRPEKEFGGELGGGATQFPALRGVAEITGELAVTAARTLRVKNAAELGRAAGFRNHDPVERQRIGSSKELQQIEPEPAEDLMRRAVHVQPAILSAGYSRRAPPDDFREQLLLVAKMPVESLLRGSRPRGDELHGRLRETAFEEYAIRDRHDFFAPPLAPWHAPRGAFGETVP